MVRLLPSYPGEQHHCVCDDKLMLHYFRLLSHTGVSDLPQIMKQLRSESWSRSLDNRFKAESKACGQRSSYNGMEVSIRSWIQVNPFPTWEDLEAVFREVDEFSIASKIKDIIPDMN